MVPPRARWAFVLLGLSLATSACQRERGGTDVAQAADSTATADSTRVASKGKTEKAARRSPLDFFHRKNKDKEKVKEEPVPVELAAVSVRDLPTYLSSTATLEPENKAEILSKTSGAVLALAVEEGDWVKQGQLLARIESDAQAVQLEESAARARKLSSDLERVRALHEQQLASDKDFSDAQSAWEQAEAARKTAALNLDYTRITAPFAGQVARRSIDRGQNVTIGTPLFTLVDPDPLLAAIYLPEREVRRLAPEQEVLISPDTDPDRDVRGMVLRIAPIVDERTGTIKVTCRVSTVSSGQALRPGSFVRVKLPTAVHAGAKVLPKRAVVLEGGENYVWKAVADSVTKVSVLTGAVEGGWIEIVSGLERDDRVVTVGQGGLRSGSKLRVLAAGADSTATAADRDAP